MTTIVWSKHAVADLEAIEAFIAQDQPIAARRLVQKIIQRTDRLRRYPESGGLVEEDGRKRYRQVLQGNYRVIYRYHLESKTAFIVTVLHAARLLDPDQLEDHQ